MDTAQPAPSHWLLFLSGLYYKVLLPPDVFEAKSRGVTQVDEKGHEGNTAALVTAYNIYFGGNMVNETARQEEFLLTTITHFEHLKN